MLLIIELYSAFLGNQFLEIFPWKLKVLSQMGKFNLVSCIFSILFCPLLFFFFSLLYLFLWGWCLFSLVILLVFKLSRNNINHVCYLKYISPRTNIIKYISGVVLHAANRIPSHLKLFLQWAGTVSTMVIWRSSFLHT
jgi:hypothetical protein